MALVIASSVAPLAPPAGAAAQPYRELGVYKGSGNRSGVASFESWLGRSTGWVLDYVPGRTWDSFEAAGWSADQWSGSGHRVVYSVPLIPDSGGSLEAGAAGAYDGHFTRLAQRLVQEGQANAVLRLGWEFNGNWYRWSAVNNPEAFASYWRKIVRSVRAVPGADFQFDWSPNPGPSSFALERAYPGDDYVHYIGLSAYDQGWAEGWQDPVRRWQTTVNQPYGLRWQRDFAAAHGKRMSYPEWGLSVRYDGHGGGDNPYYVERMHEWVNTNNVAYHLYFDFDAGDGRHKLTGGDFPRASQRMKELFGGEPATAPSASGPITVKHSRKVIGVAAASQANGVLAVQWEWAGGAEQHFRLEPLGDGYHRIVAQHSGKVLGVSGDSYADGAKIIQWDWLGVANQRFKLQSLGDGYYLIRAKHSGKVLDVTGASTSNGANLIQWGWTGGDNQRFRW